MYKISLAKKVFISLFLLVLFSKPTAAAEKPEIFVQLGHRDWVNSVAFSPDGRYALSGSVASSSFGMLQQAGRYGNLKGIQGVFPPQPFLLMGDTLCQEAGITPSNSGM